MSSGRTTKRAPALILTGAVAGFAGVILFHAGAAVPLAAGTRPGGPAARAAATGPPGPAHKRAGGGAGHSPAHAARGATGTRVATGSGVNFGYGTIAVRVTVTGSRITRVQVASLSTLEPTSQQICAQAIPMLRGEVLSAQSASIYGVSGATYTSAGYARSLQSALDQLHA